MSQHDSWALKEEKELRELAINPSGDGQGILARALLELASRLTRTSDELKASDTWSHQGVLTQVSGGGGMIETDLALNEGDFLDMEFTYDQSAPALRALAHIVSVGIDDKPSYAFRFRAIHGRDQEALIRYVYEIQRQITNDTYGL